MLNYESRNVRTRCLCSLEMDSRSRSIIIGVVALLILVLLFGIIFYFNRLSQEGSETPTLTDESQFPGLSPVPSGPGTTEVKTFSGTGFNFDYPATWGLLTCSNTNNLELDPQNGADERDIVCDEAIKPVTFIVSNTATSCQGTTVTLGGNEVTKSQTNVATGHVDYRWCVNIDGTGLDITHRVSAAGLPAHSNTDYSAQVEQLISTIKATPK